MRFLGPVTQDQGIERVVVGSDGGGLIAVPLDRYSWGSRPGNVLPENCGSFNRYWQYAGTVNVHVYVDAGKIPSDTSFRSRVSSSAPTTVTIGLVNFGRDRDQPPFRFRRTP